MDKLQMCRICLVEDVRMYVVVNKDLRALYEKLTDIPFFTEDRRPILACFFCCAKLKQCFRLMRKSLEAEELFAQILDEDYEPNPLVNPDPLELYNGFITTPTELISIVDKCQTESIANGEHLQAVCETLDDIFELKEENLSDDQEPENDDNTYLDVPVLDVSIKVEETIDVSKQEKAAMVTNSALVKRRTSLEDTTTAELKKNEPSSLKVFRTTRTRSSKPGTSHKETYQCDICQRSFNHKNSLRIHYRVHTGEKPYKCDVCQRSFSQGHHLTKHIRIHTGDKPFKCDICQRSFSEAGSLTKHIRTHTGEKPFKCNVCQRGFTESGGLRNHIRIHTGEKPFKCHVCQRGFAEKSSLTKHFRTHTGEKRYKCDVCQRSFTQTSQLTSHIRTHTGENTYKCDVCQHSFSRKFNLTKHMRIHTGENSSSSSTS